MGFEDKLLRKIDKLYSYNDKLEYLNSQYLKADTSDKEKIILDMLEQLAFFGK